MGETLCTQMQIWLENTKLDLVSQVRLDVKNIVLHMET
jgi:hypothetical protein